MKPQYLLIILLPFLYLSLSCNGKGKAGMEIVDTDSLPDEPDEKTLPDSIGMIMLSPDTVIMPTERIEVKVYNNSKQSKIQTGLNFKIDRFTEDGWVECPKKFTLAINSIGLELRPTGSHEFKIPLIQLKLDRKYKKYRVTKTASMGLLGDKVCKNDTVFSCEFYIIVPDSLDLEADPTNHYQSPQYIRYLNET
ncbi:MAG: hypothetical protein K1W02_06935 [Muribaculaceae bacterium]|jgi:hypothetical protein